jgi:vacuolar-type H+-ATPase subunit C/Vma6
VDGKFIYPNGRVRALELQLVSDRMWQMLLSADDREEAIRLLTDTWYSLFIEQHKLGDTFHQAQQATERELLELSEDPRLVRGLLHRRDVRNARYLWKAALVGTDEDIELEREGMVSVDTLRRAVEDEHAREELPELFGQTLDRLLDMTEPAATEVDREMDRLAAEVELEELPDLGESFEKLVRWNVERKNFLTAGRASLREDPPEEVRKMLLEGGVHDPDEVVSAYRKGRLPELLASGHGQEELASVLADCLSQGSFMEFERSGDRELLDRLEEVSFHVFGPAPLAAFVLKREMEIEHLRILLAAKSAGVPRKRILRRLPRG